MSTAGSVPPPGESTQADPGQITREIEALRIMGAQRFDPVRFGFIDALARRTAGLEGEVAQALACRLAGLLKACRDRFMQARDEAEAACSNLAAQHPQAAQEFWRLHASGDFRALHGLGARLQARHAGAPLADLLRHIDRHAAQPGAPLELKALRQSRDIWAKLGIDRQLARSRAKAPENPGPLNSHLLVLRSLQQMQEISPAYLQRFVSHVDALLWLDQVTPGHSPPPAGAARREGGRKRKAARGESG